MSNKEALKVLLKILIPPAIVIISIYLFGFAKGTLVLLAVIGFYLFKNRVGVYSFMGKLRYSKHDINGALNWYKRAANVNGAHPRTIASYGYLLLKCGKLGESDKVFNSLLSRKLSKEDLLYIKGNAALLHWKKGNLDLAVETLEEVHSNDFKSSISYGSLGFLLILKGDLEKALSFNLEAYEYNNTNTIIMDNLGQTYLLLGQLEKSEEIYSKLMTLNPSFPEAFYNYGLLKLAQGKKEEALETMKKALRFKFSFLSGVSLETVQAKISEIEQLIANEGTVKEIAEDTTVQELVEEDSDTVQESDAQVSGTSDTEAEDTAKVDTANMGMDTKDKGNQTGQDVNKEEE